MDQQAYDPDILPQAPFRTKRLVLRPFVLDDAEKVHSALDLDPEVWRFDPGYAPTFDDRLRNFARYTMLQEHFGVCPCGAWLNSGEFVGQGGLNPHVFDHRDGSRSVEFEVMYKIARPYWGQGYAKEIAHFWVDFAFTYIRLPRLINCVDRDNVASVSVLQALGATLEDDWLEEGTVIGTLLALP